MEKTFDLKRKEKNPKVVSEVVKDDQIIFVSGSTVNGRSPQVTVNQIKHFICSESRSSKRKLHMAAELTCMTCGDLWHIFIIRN